MSVNNSLLLPFYTPWFTTVHLHVLLFGFLIMPVFVIVVAERKQHMKVGTANLFPNKNIIHKLYQSFNLLFPFHILVGRIFLTENQFWNVEKQISA